MVFDDELLTALLTQRQVPGGSSLRITTSTNSFVQKDGNRKRIFTISWTQGKLIPMSSKNYNQKENNND